MEMYLRFMTTLAFGLVGLGMVLKVLLDQVFHDWDAFADLADWFKGLSERQPGAVVEARAEDIRLAVEYAKNPGLRTRTIDLRREQLRQLEEVEHRIKRGAQPVALTPIAPVYAAPASNQAQ